MFITSTVANLGEKYDNNLSLISDLILVTIESYINLV
jgi:hypothetical protein